MISSMTAFAKEQCDTPLGPVNIELRTVNHRYLDLHFKLPDVLRPMEIRWRDKARKTLARGKVDIVARLLGPTLDETDLELDAVKLAQLISAAEAVDGRMQNPAPINAMEVLRWPGIIREYRDENAEPALFEQASAAFDACLDTIHECRRREGDALVDMIRERLSMMDTIIADCRNALPELLQQQRRRLANRLQELSVDPNNDRVEQEMVILANKSDVAEELDRLAAHTIEIHRVLEKGGPCGRRLDFLMQELNREANTLSAKAMAIESTRDAVELKVLIEQMREQIQNIE